MKIRIIKNAPLEDHCSDISNLISQEFEVLQQYENYVIVENNDLRFAVYDDEYEVVES